MKMIPLVSVIMPVYNCESYINAAIDSILNQTFLDFEFLIIDDASTDSTLSLIRKYKDPRIILCEKPQNTGYTNSLNYGLSIAKGKYVARMDGDDISHTERFQKQISFLEQNSEIILCGTRFQIIGSNTVSEIPEYHDDIKTTMLSYCCIGHPTTMFRKSIIDQYSIKYNVEKEPAEDYDLWVRLLSIGKLHNLPEALLYYRVHESQTSYQRSIRQKIVSTETKIKLLNNLGLTLSNQEQHILQEVIFQQRLELFSDIELFFGLKGKLINLNRKGYFQISYFQNFLNSIENQVLKNYFLNRNNFSPNIYFDYLIVKKENFKLTPLEHLKFLIKSLIFFKSKI